MAKRDRSYISKECHDFIDVMWQNKIVGFDNTIGNKTVFLFLAALGLGKPAESFKRKSAGFFRNEVLAEDVLARALMYSIRLGKMGKNNDLDALVDLDKSEEECELCVEAGYKVLQKKYEEADEDEKVLVMALLNELEEMYEKNVGEDE